MPDEPLVSVVIPCYNAAPFIAEAIESALGQDYDCIEVIVVDDGSTDTSPQVVRSFGERVRLECFPHNQGVNFARNRGVEIARGAFIQFLDADDVLHPERVSRSVEAFDENIDVVFTGIEFFGELTESSELPQCSEAAQLSAAQRDPKPSPTEWDPEFPAEFFVRNGVQTSQLLHRKDYLLQTGSSDRSLSVLDDYEFHFRLVLAGTRFKRLREPLVRYRQHEGPDRLRHAPSRPDTTLTIFGMRVDQAREAGALDGRLRGVLAAQMALLARIAGIERAEALYLRFRGA